MIVATAGHIDHGKTALVRALTGIDADRLPEEKARGITIDLGFAYLRLPGGETVGFVDVPGHERLVRTMVAGAGGVDAALLVVAADDGVMPQTREHVAILDLLGVDRGVAAITKSDRAGPERLAAAEREVRGLLHGTALAGVPVVACSSLTGDGIADIARHLRDAAPEVRARPATGRFRLAVDRSFTLPGAGLIVTGLVHAGRVGVDDRLVLSPAGIELRVRGLHAQNESALTGVAGQRCALNVTGARLEKAAVKRGDWIVAPELHAPTARLDVRLHVLAAEPRPLPHRASVHLHLGAASVTGRVALRDAAAVEPGEGALAQLVLDAQVGALWGDRFVLRDASAQRTLGGGRVIDPHPPRGRGQRAERRAVLAAMEQEDAANALRALLDAAPAGLDLDWFRLARNLDGTEAARLSVACGVVEIAVPGKRLGLTAERWQAAKAGVAEALAAHHERHPDEPGATVEELAGTALPSAQPLAVAATGALAETGEIRRSGQLLYLSGREVRLAPADALLWDELQAVLTAAGLDPPRVSAVVELLGVAEEEIRPLLDKLGRLGWLCRVSAAYFVLPEIVDRLAEMAARVAEASVAGLLTVGRFREATGISRHATMPVLEYFDRTGFTVRLNDGRRLRERLSASPIRRCGAG